jgi:integrase
MARPRQPGSIKKLGPGRYQAVLYTGHDVLGKERRVTKVFHAPNDTAAGRTAPFDELRARATKAKTDSGTVRQLADRWVKSKQTKGDSPTTIDAIAPHVASIKKHLGKVQVRDLTGDHVDAWLEVLRTEKVKRKRSEATIHHYFATLRTMLRWARKRRLVSIIATEEVDSPSPRKYEARPPTGAAVQVALAAAAGDFKVALELLTATGMRRGELVGLRWTDLTGTRLRIERSIVELDGGGIVVKPPKSDKARPVSLTQETVDMLAAHHADLQARSPGLREDAYMFPALRLAADGSEPHRPTWVNLNWTRIKRATGIQCRPHDLRHWHASELLLHGVPMAVVSKRLGHSKESTTSDIYSHVLDEDDDVAAMEAQRALGR